MTLLKRLAYEEEWQGLVDMHRTLKPFKSVTRTLESEGCDGTYGSVWEGLPATPDLDTRPVSQVRNQCQLWAPRRLLSCNLV